MSRVLAVSASSSSLTARGALLRGVISDFGPGDNKTVRRPVEELPSGRTLDAAFLTAKARAGDDDASALFRIEIAVEASAGGIITQIAHGVGWLDFYLLPAHTQLAGVIAGAQYDIEVIDDQGHVYTIERGRIQPTIPSADANRPHDPSPAWSASAVSTELPTGQSRRIPEELIDDLVASDDYALTRPVWLPVGRTLTSLVFYAFTNPTDLAGSALVTAAATVDDNGAGTGLAKVTIPFTEGQTNQLRSVRTWRAVATLDNGAKCTVRCGAIVAQDDITDASEAAVDTVAFDPVSVTVAAGNTINSTVRCYSVGGAELTGCAIAGVQSSSTGNATVSPSSGVSPLTVTVTGVTDDTTATVAAASEGVAATPLDVTISELYIPSPLPFIWVKRDTLTALADTDPVTAWTDQSANGWDLSVEGANPPHWDATTLGGSVKFDSTFSEALINAAFDSLDPATGFTLFIVAVLGSGGLLSGHSSGVTDALAVGYLSGGYFRFLPTGDPNNLYSRYAFSSATAHVFTLVYDGAGSANADKVQQYLDGVDQGPLDFWGTIPASLSGMTNIILGRILGGSYLTGNIAEVYGLPGALGSTPLGTVHTALLGKYSL